jgi:hypothetical protein
VKSHVASLFQRKRLEIEGADGTRIFSSTQSRTASTGALEIRDGYDWLQKIKRAQAARIATMDQRR